MPLDGKLLLRAKTALENKRRSHELRYERRLAQVYSVCPRIRELDIEIKSTIADVITSALKQGINPGESVENIRVKNLELQEIRRRELIRAGFSADYLDDGYLCENCRDTGYNGTVICTCLMALYKEEQKAALSSLLKLGAETFETFDLSYYDNTPDAETGLSPRQNMEFVYKTCMQYARTFGSKSDNLLFKGDPGLGKTFLSACIARVTAENRFSVVYDTASSVFSKFEDYKFQRTDNPEAARDEVRRCLESDLLILDDLGTEMTTAFTASALYELINSRLISGKKTIISTNFTLAELRRRYSEQVMSRLEGEYQILNFYGSDIRRLKK